MKMTQKKKGFTLIELIVVIAIIGILAAVTIPRFSGFQDNARIKATLADARNIASAVEALTTDEKTFITTAGNAEATAAYNPAEIMGYVGKALGGELTFAVGGSGDLTSFTYIKRFGTTDYFSVKYTMLTSAFTSGALDAIIGPSKIAAPGSFTPTTVDTVFE